MEKNIKNYQFNIIRNENETAKTFSVYAHDKKEAKDLMRRVCLVFDWLAFDFRNTRRVDNQDYAKHYYDSQLEKLDEYERRKRFN